MSMSSVMPPIQQGDMQSGGVEAARTGNACVTCRERKVKCSGSNPCRFCVRRRFECVFRETRKRKLYDVKYVQALESRVKSAGGGLRLPAGGLAQSQLPRRASTPAEDPEATQTHTLLQTPNKMIDEGAVPGQYLIDYGHVFSATPGPQSNNELEARESGVASQIRNSNTTPSVIYTDPSLSSSVNFGNEVKAIPGNSRLSEHSNDNPIAKSPDNAYGLSFKSPRSPAGPDNLMWPSETEAEELLSTVMNSVGKLQHLFDPRVFSDRLSRDYTHIVKGYRPEDAWDVELLLVLAVGALLKGRKTGADNFPGVNLFTEANLRFPDLIQLRASGTLGVEICGLSAFFLQCADRKEDAHIYAGSALQLSISMGIFRAGRSRGLPRSESVHRNRLAWSIYMQERRLAAATGNQSLISDESISIERPVDSPGFCSAAILNVNIDIATVTGNILKTVYNHNDRSEEKFVSGGREILLSLAHARQRIPTDCVMDFSRPSPITRNCVTLNLMLYQAIILTTRPALLHLAKAKITNQSISIRDDVFEKFYKTCIDAAERSLFVLCAAKEQNLIAPFGFFDLDALFSIAFVLILAEKVLSNDEKERVSHGLRITMDLFDHLAERGNKASLSRKADVEQMCNHLGISTKSAENSHSRHMQEGLSPRENTATTLRYDPVMEIIQTTGRQQPHNAADPVSYFDQFLSSGLSPLGETENILYDSLSDSVPHGLYNIYNNNDLMFSGSVELDWEELERQLLLHQ